MYRFDVDYLGKLLELDDNISTSKQCCWVMNKYTYTDLRALRDANFNKIFPEWDETILGHICSINNNMKNGDIVLREMTYHDIETKLITFVKQGKKPEELSIFNSTDETFILICLAQKATGRKSISWQRVIKAMGYGRDTKPDTLYKRYVRILKQIGDDDG